MPFKSKAQQRYLFSQKPEIADRFARETPVGSYGKLPEVAKRGKKKKKAASMASMLTALRRMGPSDAE